MDYLPGMMNILFSLQKLDSAMKITNRLWATCTLKNSSANSGNRRDAKSELTQYHKDLAASVQKVTEELIFYILKHLKKITGLNNVCVAGGVAQNSVANGKIAASTGFENVYIPSAGHDAGISMDRHYIFIIIFLACQGLLLYILLIPEAGSRMMKLKRS